MADFYIDPSQPANGTGTLQSPYNSFNELNAITGDQAGNRWFIKRGTRITQALTVTGASNFTIDSYGDAARPPLIDSCLVVNPAAFLKDATGWYYPSSKAVRIIGLADDWDSLNADPIDVATQAELAPGYTWHDSTNGRQYIADDPSSWPVILICGQNARSLQLLNCSGTITVKNIAVRGAEVVNFAITGFGTGHIEVNDCEMLFGGSYGAPAGSGFSNCAIYGDVAQTGKSFRVARCRTKRAVNTGIEYGGWDGRCVVERNTVLENGTQIELWGGTSGTSRVEGNKVSGYRPIGAAVTAHGNFVWTAPGSLSGFGTQGIVEILGNDMDSCRSNGIHIENGTTVRIRHNTIRNHGQVPNGTPPTQAAILVRNTDSVAGMSVDVSGNLIQPGSKQGYLIDSVSDANTTFTSDYNAYVPRVRDSGNTVTSYTFTHNSAGASSGALSNCLDNHVSNHSLDTNSVVLDGKNIDDDLRVFDVPKTWAANEGRVMIPNGALPDYQIAPGARALSANRIIRKKRPFSSYGTPHAVFRFDNIVHGHTPSAPYTPTQGDVLDLFGSIHRSPAYCSRTNASHNSPVADAGGAKILTSGHGFSLLQGLNQFTGDFTVVLVIRFDSPITEPMGFLRNDLTASPWIHSALRFNNNNLQLLGNDTNGFFLVNILPTASVSTGVWYHASIAYDATASTLTGRFGRVDDSVVYQGQRSSYSEVTGASRGNSKLGFYNSGVEGAVATLKRAAVFKNVLSDADLLDFVNTV